MVFTFAGSNPAPPTKIVRRNNRDRRFFEILESLDENPEKNAGVAQLVERQPSKLNVAGSNPVSRSKITSRCSSVVERFLGKEEVPSSILGIGSIC